MKMQKRLVGLGNGKNGTKIKSGLILIKDNYTFSPYSDAPKVVKFGWKVRDKIDFHKETPW